MNFSKKYFKRLIPAFLGTFILLFSQCTKDSMVDFTGSYVNQNDDCFDNGYVLNITPLTGNEVNLSGLGNSPDIILVGKTDGEDIDLVTTTLNGVLTVGGSGVLVNDILTINYTVSQSGGGSMACTAIFNK